MDIQRTEPLQHFTGPEGEKIEVEVENSRRALRIRMTVNGKPSRVFADYHGVLVHEGFGWAFAYWEGVLPVEIPFRILEARKV